MWFSYDLLLVCVMVIIISMLLLYSIHIIFYYQVYSEVMHYFFLKQLREFTQHPSNGKVFFLCTATYITFLFLPNSYIYITYTNVHSLWISLIIIKLPHSTKFIQYSTVASLHHGIQPYAHITNTSVHHNAIIVSSTVVHSHVGNYFYGLLGIFPQL